MLLTPGLVQARVAWTLRYQPKFKLFCHSWWDFQSTSSHFYKEESEVAVCTSKCINFHSVRWSYISILDRRHNTEIPPFINRGAYRGNGWEQTMLLVANNRQVHSSLLCFSLLTDSKEDCKFCLILFSVKSAAKLHLTSSDKAISLHVQIFARGYPLVGQFFLPATKGAWKIKCHVRNNGAGVKDLECEKLIFGTIRILKNRYLFNASVVSDLKYTWRCFI